ncbi:aminotransferase class V-fold PLP-dependent enzyme [Clostridium sp. AF23-6LB]|jgi:cysteine desulfurase/selenocysteine lyase|uniref:aminotransferase class V-fold PLP-dependent enzyme n=1 Tax=Clostridium sp. AF23-6LB TaxID=2293005 RepID=UPI000E50DC83|nr:aminotransferase class V-fold PLP-dependent enzyme [Clostridium sp. AF23-6LB]RGG33964.1 aminotransferase class V-fold PLP-dependent enzyme [Clostridium sp. AF23-6LB]
MIYFDNAATTKYKPEEVYKAFEYFVKEVGVSPGRGSYQLGIEASRMLYKTRKKVANYFGLSNTNVVFTKNSTEAINLFFDGFLEQGDHVIISCYEHNAVLRPIHKLYEDGKITYSIIGREDLALTSEEMFSKYVKDNTKLFCLTLASNLTGRVIYSADWLNYMHKEGITTFVDSSQGAGKVRISMDNDGVDYLAFTGHKDLMAMPGVGGLCCKEVPKWEPLIQGGTGVLGDSFVNPDVFPEGYEAGTLNMPAIWSLNSAIGYCERNFERIKEKENTLMTYLMKQLKSLDNITIYDEDVNRVSTIGINVFGYKSSEIVEILDKNDICSRGGIHCAILAHEALGTVETGVVRLSLNYLNTKQEIDAVINVLNDCR